MLQWKIYIKGLAYQRQVGHFKKSFPEIVPLLQSIAQVIRSRLKEGIAPPNRTIFGVSLGQNLYKRRIQGRDIGKSKGLRLIYAILFERRLIVPLFLYSKSQMSDLTAKQLREILAELRAIIAELQN